MNEDRKLTKAGMRLIQHFEGCLEKKGDRYHAYSCPAGVLTIGFRPHQSSWQAVQCNYSMEP
jgi:GH24 family phage-related lysozyme (muramidase)